MRGLLLLLLCFPLLASAADERFGERGNWGKFEFEYDNEKPWIELQAQLPAYPKDENLLPFFVSAAADNQFFIDSASLSVDADNVVRYALLVKSPQGALNMTFEGIRCTTREKKLYAFGRPDGTWSRNRFSKWEAIQNVSRNRQHHMLYDDFLCFNKQTAPTVEAIVRALKEARLK